MIQPLGPGLLCLVVCLALGRSAVSPVRAGESDARFDVAPFALPNAPKGELRFEEARDVQAVEIAFDGAAPAGVGLEYFQEHWPGVKLERSRDRTQPCQFGWVHVDDWFNGRWRRASTRATALPGGRVRLEFAPLTAEFPDETDYDVSFRRTNGLRVAGVDPKRVTGFKVWTASAPSRSTLRVRLTRDANGRGLPRGLTAVGLEGYNAQVDAVRAVSGCRAEGKGIRDLPAEAPVDACLEVDLAHMSPSHRYSNDDGHVRFVLGDDAFTVSLASLAEQGPVWFEERGAFVTAAGDPTTLDQYRARNAGEKTVAQRVKAMPEQGYAGAFLGQPRPHGVATSLGFKQARQRFWLDCNGDLTAEATTVRQVVAADTKRVAAGPGHGRFFFGLEDWILQGRYPDPAPGLTYNLRVRRGDVELEQTSLAAPLDGHVLDGAIRGDRDLVAMVRFRFRNVGPDQRTARLRLEFSSNSGRNPPVYPSGRDGNDWRVPDSPREPLRLDGGLIRGAWRGKDVLRARTETSMTGRVEGQGLTFEQALAPGAGCELLLKAPFVALDAPGELEQLGALRFDDLRRDSAAFWRREAARGARLRTPVPQLDELHDAHLTHVQISDPAMPGLPGLVNTSVGTSTYSNCGNESCMINEELDQRGLASDAAERLAVWVHYQGTAGLLGRFTDHRGVLHGAGPFSFLATYNQNHGWILWRLAEHYEYTRDRAWFDRVAPAVLEAVDWVVRQRRETMADLPNSRGWERGFMPAGALEDVGEYRYWLTTNTMIWRGVDAAGRALEAVGHPRAAEVRREADAYAADLRRGFDTMRRHCPLVRLRDGRWVPYFPTQLYRRGRDVGWLRETLEGSVYLLISGLYDPRGPEAAWILDDYQDNRYISPPFGYAIVDLESEWFDRGGFSIQPNLLAGLMPYLDRDEPEVYIWMFFNAWAACYREEIGAMVEHPMPVLGYANTAHPKTSDEANAVMWLRYLFVHGPRDGLYLGRAVPRAWLDQPSPIGLEGVRTRWGKTSVRFGPAADGQSVRVHAELDLHAQPPRTVLRVRHPSGKPIASVTVNGREHRAFDAAKQDVDLTGMTGELDVDVRF